MRSVHLCLVCVYATLCTVYSHFTKTNAIKKKKNAFSRFSIVSLRSLHYRCVPFFIFYFFSSLVRRIHRLYCLRSCDHAMVLVMVCCNTIFFFFFSFCSGHKQNFTRTAVGIHMRHRCTVKIFRQKKKKMKTKKQFSVYDWPHALNKSNCISTHTHTHPFDQSQKLSLSNEHS